MEMNVVKGYSPVGFLGRFFAFLGVTVNLWLPIPQFHNLITVKRTLLAQKKVDLPL